MRNNNKDKFSSRALGIVISAAFVVLIFTVILLAPVLEDKAYAYSLITSRSIEISNAATSATGTSYFVQFTTADNIQDVILDFCPDSPLYSDTCSTLTGFSAAGAGFTAGAGTSGWTIATATADHVEIQGASATGTINFTLTNITNPSALGSFYGRIYAYTSTTTGYTGPTSPGSASDFGGIALSTASAVDVTARVEEQITFCVASAAITNDCANAGSNPPNIDIGHGSPLILDSTAVDSANAYMQTTTNAVNGVSVRMKDNNSCGGLSDDGGVTCGIPPVGATVSTITAGVADFGLNVSSGTGGIGSVSPTSPYNGTSGQYGMDNTSLPDNITTTYGSQIAISGGGVQNVNNVLTFAATASNTTPAGVYTADMTLIATGTY